MATPLNQRIGIWVITIVMAIGSIGVFFVSILANNNDQEAFKKQQEEQQRMIKEMREKAAEKMKPLDGYLAEKFKAEEVTSLRIESLKEGDGEEVGRDSTIEANYFGWTADGKIFDSTNDGSDTKPRSFSLTGVIKGWTDGLDGARVGSVRKLTIPADMAYGDDASSGRPTGPLQFIIEIKSLKK